MYIARAHTPPAHFYVDRTWHRLVKDRMDLEGLECHGGVYCGCAVVACPAESGRARPLATWRVTDRRRGAG